MMSGSFWDALPIQASATRYDKWYIKLLVIVVMWGQAFLMLFLAALVVKLAWVVI